jgi:ABC-type nitrate/sulfonate/bicarbonate transport system permease component
MGAPRGDHRRAARNLGDRCAVGWLFQDVVPTLPVIARAVLRTLSDPAFYRNLKVTAGEIAAALVIGGTAGMVIGLMLGSSRFLSRAYEAFIHYLGPTPKIIFFPIMILWFGTGPGRRSRWARCRASSPS